MVLINLLQGSNGDAEIRGQTYGHGGEGRRGWDEWREFVETHTLPYVK